MDEKTAWENFTATGSVMDYLAYCHAKNDVSHNGIQNISSEGFYDNDRWSDTERTERWRK